MDPNELPDPSNNHSQNLVTAFQQTKDQSIIKTVLIGQIKENEEKKDHEIYEQALRDYELVTAELEKASKQEYEMKLKKKSQ